MISEDFFKYRIIESGRFLDQLTEEFKYWIMKGIDPNTVADEVFKNVGCNIEDLTSTDLKELKRRVESMY